MTGLGKLSLLQDLLPQVQSCACPKMSSAVLTRSPTPWVGYPRPSHIASPGYRKTMEKFHAAQSLLGVHPLPQSPELLVSSDQTWVTWSYQKRRNNPHIHKIFHQLHPTLPGIFRKASGVNPENPMLAMPSFAIPGNNSCLPPA